MHFPNFADPNMWASLLMLTFMEIILGIDNIIFISIVANRLDAAEQAKGRNIGLFMAMLFRIILLFGLSFVLQMKEPFYHFDILNKHVGITGQSLILLAGGLFLIYKSVTEIHHKMEGENEENYDKKKSGAQKLMNVVIQICLINIVFSIDSIVTAIGLTDDIGVMMLSVIFSMVVMMIFSGPVGRFINEHPSMQMLGLSFLILIGFMLLAEGLHQMHLIGNPEQEEVIPKGYLYFAIFFSLAVELLNMRIRGKSKTPAVQLHGALEEAEEEGLLEEEK
jgi:predicted tellurium resistance membrane protein TerC